MTITALWSLHAIIGDAIDDIERVYAANHSNPTSARHTPEKLFPSSPSSTAAQQPTPISISSGRNRNPVSALTNLQAYVSPPPSPTMATSPQLVPAIE
ncbi:hypothetical protein CVT25_014791 [Psilocybe cyanescens]|uniref:Uncharacterized protein n=1 Tax=Psilocybe cyanescens TaxID=93625 RepID=A0A409X8X2_PSICY|nr:hypothetical protein CVT25_014791 [Psilocybe cyanescens]